MPNMQYSTGRDSRMKHATGSEVEKMKDARSKHPRPCHATGSDSSLRHMTGERFDLKREMELDEQEEERLSETEGQKGWQKPLPVAR